MYNHLITPCSFSCPGTTHIAVLLPRSRTPCQVESASTAGTHPGCGPTPFSSRATGEGALWGLRWEAGGSNIPAGRRRRPELTGRAAGGGCPSGGAAAASLSAARGRPLGGRETVTMATAPPRRVPLWEGEGLPHQGAWSTSRGRGHTEGEGPPRGGGSIKTGRGRPPIPPHQWRGRGAPDVSGGSACTWARGRGARRRAGGGREAGGRQGGRCAAEAPLPLPCSGGLQAPRGPTRLCPARLPPPRSRPAAAPPAEGEGAAAAAPRQSPPCRGRSR